VIPRVRMARKRLAIAQERFQTAYHRCCFSDVYPVTKEPAWHRSGRRWATLRAIERRKDAIK
jgi:trimethylamine:corrinoid methyltransferase-like protein